MSGAHGSNAFPAVYSVNIFYKGDHTFTSDAFSSRNEAEDFLDYCRRMDMNSIQFQIYKQSPRGEAEYNDYSTHVNDHENDHVNDHENEWLSSDFNLTGMTLESYKRGYLLRPMPHDHRKGTKSFMGGFWNKTLEAWVFRPADKNMLVDHGAQLVNELVLSEDEHEAEVASAAQILAGLKVKGMQLEDYGRGYMLYPKANHAHYGQPYFHKGWWNEKQKGWFFKSEFFDELIAAGVKYQHTHASKTSRASTRLKRN